MPPRWYKRSVQKAFRQSVASTWPVGPINCAKAYSVRKAHTMTLHLVENHVFDFFPPVFIMNDILKCVFIVVY